MKALITKISILRQPLYNGVSNDQQMGAHVFFEIYTNIAADNGLLLDGTHPSIHPSIHQGCFIGHGQA